MRNVPWLAALLTLCACSHQRPNRPAEQLRCSVQNAASNVDTASPPCASGVELTTTKRLRPVTELRSPPHEQSPGYLSVRKELEDAGYGELREEPGEPYIKRTLGGTPPPPGAHPRRLARFIHLSDIHLADDESPARAATYDDPGEAAGAMRPQEGEICRLLDAAVRTINELHRREPLDFVLLGGDSIDNAQGNELQWLLSILGGSPNVKCDSGSNDDPVPGPDNDGKDPFSAQGLKVPWKWVTGNHDVLLQGTAVIDLGLFGIKGSFAPGGTRDYERGGEIFRGSFVIPDDRRSLLRRRELLEMVRQDGDGHGLTPALVEAERASYTFDIGARFLVLDTAAETGGAAGLLRRQDADRFLLPTLEKSASEHKPVIMVSHHAYDGIKQDGGRFGRAFPDALNGKELARIVGDSNAVAFSIVGHNHKHRVRHVRTPKGPGFWEVTTSALADFPHQFRIIELWDQDNGWQMMRATCVDVALEGNTVAELARKRGVIDFVSGYAGDEGPGAPEDRNVELWAPTPKGHLNSAPSGLT